MTDIEYRDHVYKVVSQVTDIQLYMLMSRVRKRHILLARRLIAIILLENFTLSYAGELMGGYDHTTMLHHKKQFPADKVMFDWIVQAEIVVREKLKYVKPTKRKK